MNLVDIHNPDRNTVGISIVIRISVNSVASNKVLQFMNIDFSFDVIVLMCKVINRTL